MFSLMVCENVSDCEDKRPEILHFQPRSICINKLFRLALSARLINKTYQQMELDTTRQTRQLLEQIFHPTKCDNKSI